MSVTDRAGLKHHTRGTCGDDCRNLREETTPGSNVVSEPGVSYFWTSNSIDTVFVVAAITFVLLVVTLGGLRLLWRLLLING